MALQFTWKRVSGHTTPGLKEGSSSYFSIPYNPVFFSYAAITPTTATLYVDSNKFTENVHSHLGDKVLIKPYNAIFEDTKAMAESLASESTEAEKPKTKFILSTKASWALSLNLGGEDQVDEIRSPVADAKAIKNSTELEGMRACHVRDGAALSEYFAWLEEELVVKGSKLDEVQGADKLESLRS